MKWTCLFLLLFLCNGCKENSWSGVVYPDRNNLTKYKRIGEYHSRDDCVTASLKMLEHLNSLDDGTYECGLNCKKDSDDPDFYICEESY